MSETKFKVGDRVRALAETTCDDLIGPGVVVAVGLHQDSWIDVVLDDGRQVVCLAQFLEPLPTASEPPTKSDHAVRKGQPIARGVLDYFPDAIKAVAECSRVGNDQHNPGQDMHHARAKSSDHADCVVRHLMERGTVDTDGVRHSAKVAWRALAMLQEELEAAGAPKARGAR